MTLEQKQQLKKQLWGIANELRGKMDADEFRDYILGFNDYESITVGWFFTSTYPKNSINMPTSYSKPKP